MIYEYSCEICGPMDIEKPVALIDHPEMCDCGKVMTRRTFPRTVELQGATDKEPEYNHAFGKVIKNKHDLRNELTRIEGETGKKLEEVGNDSLKSIQKPRKSVNREEVIRELRYRIRHG